MGSSKNLLDKSCSPPAIKEKNSFGLRSPIWIDSGFIIAIDVLRSIQMGLWNGRPLSHWNWLCDLFKDLDYQEICMANANNRKQQKYSHRGGAQPFVRHVQAKVKLIRLLRALHLIPLRCHWNQSSRSWMRTLAGRVGPFVALVHYLGCRNPHLGCAFCYGPSMDQWTEMQTQFSQIVGSVFALQKENEKLRAELEAIKGSHGQSSGESLQQQHQICRPSSDDAYDHLSPTNSDEYRA
ncbi:hypothetical protein GBA52_003472 [Prunus armeniaca]|nr:hypothetical protein GBA52_003472 [Prunus armeniaca]